MTPEIDEMRPLTAGRMLTLRQEETARGGDPLEVGARCNARILAECCFRGGEAVFADGKAVLKRLTFSEMERLLRDLAGAESPASAAARNPRFDPERYRVMRGGRA